MPELAGRTPAGQLAPLVTLVLALSPPAALAAEPDDASRGYPDNPVSDYVDRSSDGLTPVDPPGTSAPSLTSIEVETPSAAPPGAPKPAEWMLVPIPGYNPTLGFMLTGMGAYIFPADAKSPPSTVGGFGMFSTNGSWALGGIAKMNLAEDHYRVLGFLFLGHINWDFYGIGNEAADRGQFVPLSQGMAGGRLESLFRIAQGLYLGPRWTLMKMRSTADLSQVQVPPELVPPSNELVSWFSAPGAKLQWDTRDSQFFPRRGQLMELSFDVHLKALGDSFDYVAGKLAWNQYLGLTPRQVLAFREVVSLASTNTPFYALPRLGQGSDIRGFKAGEYQDNILLAAQVEYRLQILAWLGAVAFLGVGEVEPELGSLNFKDLLPAGGVGARVTVAKANHINARADVAFSKQGVSFYFAVGEAF
ncbi:MAG TPA: BamA/TamA family outer membrane protein [Myxococcaceae bacterium]|nr:BamA/TamA family outer membrane protein [Myxococcaceae bacterium]